MPDLRTRRFGAAMRHLRQHHDFRPPTAQARLRREHLAPLVDAYASNDDALQAVAAVFGWPAVRPDLKDLSYVTVAFVMSSAGHLCQTVAQWNLYCRRLALANLNPIAMATWFGRCIETAPTREAEALFGLQALDGVGWHVSPIIYAHLSLGNGPMGFLAWVPTAVRRSCSLRQLSGDVQVRFQSWTASQMVCSHVFARDAYALPHVTCVCCALARRFPKALLPPPTDADLSMAAGCD